MFLEQRIRTFADWLGYYNSPDVVPFLEALESMRGFYTGLGIDPFKDAVSLPGVSKEYLLRGTLNQKIRPGVVRPRQGGIRNDETGGFLGSEAGLLSKARSGQNENPFAQIPSCEAV